jgi:hypothetical protein
VAFYSLETGDPEIFSNCQHRCTLLIVSEQLTSVADDKQTRVGIEDRQQVVRVRNDVSSRVVL